MRPSGYYVAGRYRAGKREFVYCMTVSKGRPDSFTSDLTMAVPFASLEKLRAEARVYPCLRSLTIYKVELVARAVPPRDTKL